MTCLVRHAAWLLPRCQTWHGETPYARERGQEYRSELVSFGEKVWARRPRAKKGRKWTVRWDSVRWLGKEEANDEHIVAHEGSGEVVRVRTVRRFADGDRFVRKDPVLLGLTATPWNTKGLGLQGVQAATVDEMPQGGEPPAAAIPRVARLAAAEPGPGASSATAASAEAEEATAGSTASAPAFDGGHSEAPAMRAGARRARGETPGCPACERRGQWGHGFRHSTTCRRRNPRAEAVPVRTAGDEATAGSPASAPAAEAAESALPGPAAPVPAPTAGSPASTAMQVERPESSATAPP